MGKGHRSQVGTIYSTKEKGPRYLELTEGYISEIALDEDNEIIGYKTDNETYKNDPIKSAIKNNINALKDTGKVKLRGLGKNDVTKSKGRNLNTTLAYLCPNNLKYHIKYKFFGLANS